MTSLDDMRRELHEKFDRLKKNASNPIDPNPLKELHFKSVKEMLEKGYVPADTRGRNV